jgi:predicted Zn-dependent peptidase
MKPRHVLLACGAAMLAGSATWPLLAAQPATASVAAGPVDVQVPAHQSITLRNGLQLILVSRRDLPLVAFSAILRGGSRLDPDGRGGVATLTADLLNYGAGARDAYAFTDTVEGAGGNMDASASTEALTIRGQFLARDSTLMLDLLADVLRRPRFDAGEFEKLRARRIEALRAAKDAQPQALIGSYGRALLFAGHPYARPAGGSEASLARITLADIVAYHREQFGADRLILTIAGDFDAAAMRRAVEQRLGNWPRARAALPPLPATARHSGRRVLLIDAPGSAQTYFWLANVGVDRRYAGRAALDIANTAFGGSFISMLNSELRIKSGLSYGASSRFARGTVAGEFVISSFTKTDDTARALELALATLKRLKTGHLDAAAIDAVRRYMLGQYPMGFETAGEWAAALADLDFYGLPHSYIDRYASALLQVDAAAVARVIDAEFPDPANLDIVLIGDAARIRDAARALGPVTEKPLSATDFDP